MADSVMLRPSQFLSDHNNIRAATANLMHVIVARDFSGASPSSDNGWFTVLESNNDPAVRSVIFLWLASTGSIDTLIKVGEFFDRLQDDPCFPSYLRSICALAERLHSHFPQDGSFPLAKVVARYATENPSAQLDAFRLLALIAPNARSKVVEMLHARLRPSSTNAAAPEREHAVQILGAIVSKAEDLYPYLSDNDRFVRCYAGMFILRRFGNDKSVVAILRGEYHATVKDGDNKARERMRSILVDVGLPP